MALLELLSTSPYIVAILGVLLALYSVKNYFKKHSNIPEGPRGLPILGYLPFLGQDAYKTLHKLKKKYGSIFSLNLGGKYVVVLADNTVAKEAFKQTTFLRRGSIVPFDIHPIKFGLIAANGDLWHEQKSFSLRVLRDLGLGKSPIEINIKEEISDLLSLVDKSNGEPFDISNNLMSSVSNIITTLVFGKRLEHSDPTRDFLNQVTDAIFNYINNVTFATFFPILRPLHELLTDPFGRKRAFVLKFTSYVKEEISKHRKALQSGDTENWDYISQYLIEMEKLKSENQDTTLSEYELVGNVQAFFIAGTETTKTAILWAILATVTFPEIQSRVHQEIDNNLGRNVTPSWDDRNKVPYVMAVLQEAQRWRTIVSMGIARETTEDTNIGEYFIPKNTPIIINLYSVHRDSECWKDSEKFYPERHLTDHGSKLLKPQGYMPFSSGRRSCPGESLAIMETFCFYTALLQRYNLVVPDNTHLDIEGNFKNVLTPKSFMLHYKLRD